jgi:1-deoxy-D-xylulose-5-phosphate reductoisomerase
MSALHFDAPDTERFPCLALAYRALRAGGTMPAALNAANETAVAAFLEKRIRLTDIPRIIQNVLDRHESRPVANLDIVLETDRAARHSAAEEIDAVVSPIG